MSTQQRCNNSSSNTASLLIMRHDSPPMIFSRRRKPVVKVCLHSEPSESNPQNTHWNAYWAIQSFSILLLRSFFFSPTLPLQFPEARYQQGPLDLWWSRPLPRLAPRRLCNTPQWWWGLLKDAWLHPESPLLPPVSVRPHKEYFHFRILSTFSFFFFPTLIFLTSLTSQLTGDLLYRKAETMFFHQLYQCSVP